MFLNRKELINPVRVFFAILIVAIIWFAPIAFPLKGERAEKKDEPAPLTSLFASSAGACPFKCVVCTAWDENAWPRNCAEYICDTACEEDPSSGGGGGNQPPTITHILTCTQNGSNSWCIGNLTLDLTASDPQGSQVIISGDVNGVAFACPAGTTCSVPLPEGAGNTNYRVDASSTGLFATGTSTYFLDSSTPQLNGSVSGVAGTNGWYTSNVTLTVAASDAVSGIASTSATIDGGPQTAYSAPIVLTDGIHTVVLTTTDNAGHVTQTTQTFNIDTVTPALNVSLSGSMGLNNWYISDVTITPSASDSGSGLASLEVSVDGSAFTNYQSPITFSDGVHSYQFRATDNAGNVTESGQTLNIDTITPTLNISTTGVAGLNSWYVSNATITPTATDATSGIASFEVSQDNSQFTNYQSPITFSDGIHTYQFRVTDIAGNVTQATKAVKVDTVTPSLSLNLSGTRGQNDWYVSSTSVTPTATDATSGIASLEVSQDGSAYTAYQSTTFSDGLHTYRFKATDNAGNVTETPAQNLKVDTIAPVIEMDAELKLGEYLYYDLEDPTVAGQENSGLSIYRAVIEDDDEKYKKIAWADGLEGDKARDSILWDGKFADGTQAGWGSYFITLKISDAAGNERMQTAIVKVGPLSFLEEIPTFTPPLSALLPAQTAQTDSAAVTEFGGTNSGAMGETTSESASAGGANNATTGEESASISAGGIAIFNSDTDYVQSGFTQGSQSTSTPITNSNPSTGSGQAILWGAAAAAMLGATLADWQRKREEEEARKRAEAAAQEEEGGRSGKKTPGQIAYEKKQQQKHIVGESQAMLNEKAREKAEQAEKARQNLIAKNEDRAPVDMAKVNRLVEEAASQRTRDEYRAGEREYAVNQAEEYKAREQEKADVGNTKAHLTLSNNMLIENELRRYGIETIGVDVQHQSLLKQAADILGSYYLPYIDNQVSVSQSFVLSHGSFLVIVDKDANVKDEYNPNAICKTQNNAFLDAYLIRDLNLSIVMRKEDRYPYLASYQRDDGTNIHLPTEQSQLIVCRDQPGFYTMIHEIEHVFDNHYLNVTRDGFHLSDYLPPLQVGNNQIRYTSNGIVRTRYGFENDGKSPTRQNTGGDNLIEELADTLMNAALDGNPAHPDFGFTDDPLGDARRTDIQNLLEQKWKPNMQTYFDNMSALFK